MGPMKDEPKRQFITDHLGSGAQAAQGGVLVIGRPAGQGDAVDGDGGDGEHVERAHVDIGQAQAEFLAKERDGRTPGNDAGDDERGDNGDDRGKDKEQLIRIGGSDLFFEDQFEGIRDWLQNAARTGAIGSDAHLHARQHLAFVKRDVGKAKGHAEDDDETFNEPIR